MEERQSKDWLSKKAWSLPKPTPRRKSMSQKLMLGFHQPFYKFPLGYRLGELSSRPSINQSHHRVNGAACDPLSNRQRMRADPGG